MYPYTVLLYVIGWEILAFDSAVERFQAVAELVLPSVIQVIWAVAAHVRSLTWSVKKYWCASLASYRSVKSSSYRKLSDELISS